jgi:hypothetical protein
MESIQSTLTGIWDSAAPAIMGALLLLLVPTLYFFTLRARALLRAGKPLPLRRMPAFERLSRAMDTAAETGRPPHISLGTGAVGDSSTAESLAALHLLAPLSQQAAAYGVHPVVTAADAGLMLAAQDRLRQAFRQRGQEREYRFTDVQLIAPEPTAYAAGAMGLLSRQELSGNVMAGAFGEEYFLMAEVGAWKQPEQVAGAADPGVLPFVHVTSEAPLLGEEMFTAGAYLGKWASHIGSLFAQDWMRALLILIILAGMFLASWHG